MKNLPYVFAMCFSVMIALPLMAQDENEAGQLSWPSLSESMAEVGGGENDAALIVAIEDYDHLAKIPGAKQNAIDWYRYFTESRKIPEDKVEIMDQSLATKEQIIKAIETQTPLASGGGKMWFIFIGHGAPSEGNGVLLGVDVRATPDSFRDRSVSRDDVLQIVNSGVAQPVILFDACFSGRTQDGENHLKGIQPGENVKPIEPGKAVVVSASGSHQYSGALPGANVPAFSYLALGALQGWGDTNNDGAVTAKEMTSYSEHALRMLLSGREQTPQLDSIDPGVVLAMSGNANGPDLKEMVVQLKTGQNNATAESEEKDAQEPVVEQPAEPVPVVTAADPEPEPLPVKPEPRKNRAGFILMGAGAALGITGAIIGSVSLSKKSDLESNCNSDKQCLTSYQDDIRKVEKLNTTADVFYIASALTIGAGVALYVIQTKRSKNETALVPLVTPGGAALSLTTHF